MPNELDQQIAFILEIDKLKSVLRQTRLMDGSRRENSAEHSWHLAMMASLLSAYALEPVDTARVVRMALVHDVVEIDAGDTYAYDAAGNLDKLERERRAADRLFSLLPAPQGQELRALWEEFDAGETADARFANALDRLQPLLHNWQNHGASWRGHNLSKSQVAERMEPIRQSLPAAWPLVCRILEEAAAKGLLADDGPPHQL